ncbi:MAG: YceI family protein [Planctomycetota bacterium]
MATQEAPAPAAPRAAKPKKSFLAFRLAHDEFAFASRRAWRIVPSLSRVGFDATSTLHDFSGVTSRLHGELEADLAHPDKAPRGAIVVDAKTLDTGLEDRNAEMYDYLATKEHPEIRFEVVGFEAAKVDVDGMKVEGKVKGRMSIRGVTKDVDMPVVLAVDSSHRLSIEGEAPLDITDYEVPVPSKLGLIGMDKGVKVWIRLRARLVPRSEG